MKPFILTDVEKNALVSNIKSLFAFSDVITTRHIDRRGETWDRNDQIAKMIEELGEVSTALNKHEGKHKVIHEALDHIFTGFTLLNLITTYDDITFEHEIKVVIDKLVSRVN